MISHSDAQKAKKILLIKHRGLGDAIICMGTARAVQELFPNAELHFAGRGWVLPVFSKLKTPVSQFHELELTTPMGWWAYIRLLRNEKYDFMFEFHQVGRSAKIRQLLGWAIPGRYFFHNHFRRDSYVHDQGKIKATLQRDLDLLYSTVEDWSSKPYDERLFLRYTPELQLNKPTSKKNLAVLSMVASARFRTWPVENFNLLAWSLAKKWPDMALVSPLSSNEVDRAVEADILKLKWPANFAIVKPELSELPELLASAKFFIGHDTGQKHLAVALGTKTYTFFGPSLAHEWHPYSTETHPIFYQADLACRTETAEYCDKQDCPNRICLLQFTPEKVFEEIQI